MKDSQLESVEQYELIVFDFDGTLANSFPWFLEAINVAAEKYRFKKTPEVDLEKLRRLNHREVLKELKISWWKIPLISQFMRSYMKEEIHTISLFPEASEVLRELKKRHKKIAIVSSNSEENIKTILGPLAQIIDFYACEASLTGKTSKFKKVISMSKIEAHRTLAIGDEVRDIEAAKKLGIDAAGVTWGSSVEDILRENGARFILKNMRDILEIN